MNIPLFKYTLHLADNALILGQRNSEWCGHGPVLEQDIAITNISLDLLGQARNFYQYAASLYNNFNREEQKEADFLIPFLWKSFRRALNEDDLAFLRNERQYLNLQITELPKGDWAQTILRQFFFSAFQECFYSRLQQSGDTSFAVIAQKSLKEVTYHLRWSSEWVIRLGDGTEESNRRINQALDELWPFTAELFAAADYEQQAVHYSFGVDVTFLQEPWLQKTSEILNAATLAVPPLPKTIRNKGKEGVHTELLGSLLAEMQHLQRAYPNSTW